MNQQEPESENTNMHDLNSSNFGDSQKSGESAETGESSTNQLIENLESFDHPLKSEINMLVKKFMPRDALEEITEWKLIYEHNTPTDVAPHEAKSMVEDLIASASIGDLLWEKKLKHIFKNHYPETTRELWVNNNFAQRKYNREKKNSLSEITFSSEQFDNIKPSQGLAKTMAPALVHLEDTDDTDKVRLRDTAELLRFLNRETLALPESSLYEVASSDRPRYKDKNGWDFDKGKLPRKTVPAKLSATTYHPEIIGEFINDLRSTFAWPDDNDGTLGNYLGYLIQPLICYLKTGQMPGYSFKGPPKCGKGYLASVLVGIIYCRLGDSTVVSKMLPSNSYEMEVSLNDMRYALYMVFDEIIHASEEQLVILNSLLTQQVIQVRKFGVGYQRIDNQMTIAVTSVGRMFSDETEARLATIKLTATRPIEIDQFHDKWKSKGAELLKAVVDLINTVNLDIQESSKVADRRPGFTLVSHFVEHCFRIKPNYELQNTSNEILDDLCEMFFSKSNIGEEETPEKTQLSKVQGRKIGKRRRYSIKNFADFISSKENRPFKRREAAAQLTTALSYKSTRFHPLHKDSGYYFKYENNDRFCHIDFAEEGANGNRREWIYIEDVTPFPIKAHEIDELRLKENMKILDALNNN